MSFEDWWKENYGDKCHYDLEKLIMDDYVDCISSWKLEDLLRGAYNVGYAHRCNEDLEYD